MKHRTRVSTRHPTAHRQHEPVHAGSDRTAVQLGIAVAHHQAGRLALAEGIYRHILIEHPSHPPANHLLGLIAFQAGDNQRAVDLIQRAIAANGRVAEFHCNLAVVLRRMDRLEDALASVDRAAQLDPEFGNVELERGHALAGLGRPAEAIAAFEAVLVRDPESAWAHFGIATAALAQGDFQRGWAEYESRWRYARAEFAWQDRGFSQPLWDGQPLPGGTILLHVEQGFGDTLQFARFAPLVKARVGRVVLECQPELRGLLEGLPGVDHLLSRGDQLPDFDVQASLMSLPWLLGTQLTTIPDIVPYGPSAASRNRHADRPRLTADARLKVGLVWAGSAINQNDRQRSLSLAALAPLASVSDVAFFALQKGPAGLEAATPPSGLALTDLGPTLSDFGDTADVLEQLDLVITVDTAVAHLAGALGRPVWVLLSYAPDFRWLLDRQDSPWYPTARLFRQQRRGDWAAVIQDVCGALTSAASQHRIGLASRAISQTTSHGAPRQSEPEPKLSICIPTFNRCRYLENALTRLFTEQQFPFAFEVLVSDNASTDGTQALVEQLMQSHPQLRYLRQTHNVGGIANIVSVHRQARGEYTMYLADDDILLTAELAGVVKYLDRHAHVGVCYCAAEVWDDVQKVSVGQYYDSGPKIVFSRDTALNLCNFIVERHVFPEIYVYRSEVLRKLLYAPSKAYWAFVNMINALSYADVAFLPTIFYRSVTQHWQGEQRQQAGITQTMAEWDLYRGGLEYMLHRAFTYAGFDGVPPEQQLVTQQMVQGFVNNRMIVALRLLIQFRQYVSAYEVLVRLQANAALPESALVENRNFLVGRAALETFIQTFHAMTELRMLGLFHVDGPQNVRALIEEIEARLPVEILDHVDLQSVADKHVYLMLCGAGPHRQALIDVGFPAGQVWSEGDLTSQYRM